MTDKLSVADVLDRAATLIEPEGAWTQGAYATNDAGDVVANDGERWPINPTCFCTLGAIFWTQQTPRAGGNVASEIAEALGFECGYEVADWNDAQGRTQSQVVSKLREAANLARERGL